MEKKDFEAMDELLLDQQSPFADYPQGVLQPIEYEDANDYCKFNCAEILNLVPDEHDGYVCPECGSGAGPHGTGMTTNDDGMHWRCWSCGETRDVFDLAAILDRKGVLQVEGNSIFEKVYRKAGLLDISFEERQAVYDGTASIDYASGELGYIPNHKLHNAKAESLQQLAPVEPPNYTKMYKKCYRDFWNVKGKAAKEYMNSRGIGDDTLRKFLIGYCSPEYCARLRIPKEYVDDMTQNYPVYGDYIDTTNGIGAVLIPVSKDCYVLRNLNKESDKRYAKCTVKGNPFKIINRRILLEKVDYLYIVEGYVDALSVEEVGYHALAIGTAGSPIELKKLLTAAYKCGLLANTTLVICEDNDAPGQSGLKKIKSFLNTLTGVKFCCLDPCFGITDKDGNSLKDANDALINYREKFKMNLETAQLLEPTIAGLDNCDIKVEANTDYDITPSNNTVNENTNSVSANAIIENTDNTPLNTGTDNNSPNVDNESTANASVAPPRVPSAIEILDAMEHDDGINYIPISTGIPPLDNILGGGLRTGLYGLEGLSGLGKSSLSLQICDKLAEQGIPVLYVSLEMGMKDLVSKSLSRLMWKLTRKTKKSNTDVLQKNAVPSLWSEDDNNAYIDAVNCYRHCANRIHIVEGGLVGTAKAVQTVDVIAILMQRIKNQDGQYPIVIVDYLQKLKGANSKVYGKNLSEKQIIDESVYALHQLSTKYSVPIIGLLSMNRAGYKFETGMASAKGSGDIEYSCDVLLGINKATDPATNEVDEAAWAKNSINGEANDIEIVVIKNRYGVPNQRTTLAFYGVVSSFDNLFLPMHLSGYDRIGDGNAICEEDYTW